jgi:hypothetical protein
LTFSIEEATSLVKPNQEALAFVLRLLDTSNVAALTEEGPRQSQ